MIIQAICRANLTCHHCIWLFDFDLPYIRNHIKQNFQYSVECQNNFPIRKTCIAHFSSTFKINENYSFLFINFIFALEMTVLHVITYILFIYSIFSHFS